ncbi:uncharacterized protein LOC144828490 [Lissotriton helveticus]
MVSENVGEELQARKRKIKLSDQELEILIEEVTRRQDQLFGKQSLKVPEAAKRKLWLAIQTKVNAGGVAHRDITNVQKMCSRAKERIGNRMKAAKKTGGGTHRGRPNTPLEDLVEGTLTPEAVVGVLEIDTSEHADTSKDTEQDRNEHEGSEFHSQDFQDTDESNAATSSPTIARRSLTSRVRQLQQSESEDDENVSVQQQQAAPTPATLNTQQSRRSRLQQFYRRRPRPSQHQTAEEDERNSSVVEVKILKVQQLQGKDIRVMKGKIVKISHDIGGIHNCFQQMSNVIEQGQRAAAEKLDRVATAMEKLCTTIPAQQLASDRRHHRAMSSMQGYTRALNRLCNTTAQLSHQTVAMQLEISQCCGDVARGMMKLMNVVEGMQSEAASGSLLHVGGIHGGSNVSSLLEPSVPGGRRSTRRNEIAERPTLVDAKNSGKALGVRGRKK